MSGRTGKLKTAFFYFCIVLVSGVFISAASGAQKKTAVKTVSMGKVVTLDYTLTVGKKVIDSSAKHKQPMTVTIGKHQVIPGFEKGIMGLKVGQKKSFTVSPKEGYGQVNPKYFKEVPKSVLPKDMKLVPGMALYARMPNGQPYKVRVAKIKKDTVVIDYNNPLAGKTLHFAVQVVDIK